MGATVKDVMTVTAADLMTTPPVSENGHLAGIISRAGVLSVCSRPETVQQGRDILAEIWRIEGVVSVRDRLTYPEGM